MNYKILAFTLIAAGAIPMLTFAAGIQASPARLDFSASQGRPASQNIIVVNPTADVQIFEVYSDDFTDIIKAQPQSFTLQSGESKTVKLTVTPSLAQAEGQKLSTNLSVVAKPLADNQFSVGTGVKIPLSITAAGAPQSGTARLALMVALILFAVLAAGLGLKKYIVWKKARIAA